MFAAAIFDMDGLLIDSERPIMAAWIEAARTLDIELSHSQYLQVVGLSTVESEQILASLLGGPEAYRHAIELVRRYLQLERADGEPLFPIKPGAAEFLSALRERGIRCAVASSSTRRQIEACLGSLGLLHHFSAFAGGDEVSTIGIVYAVVAGLVVYRQFDWRRLGPMLVATASLSGAILLIIGTATAMAWGLTQSGFSRWLAEAMASLPGGAPMFLAVSLVTFVVLGSVLEGIPAIVLFGPLLFPIARQLGIHEVHYAMVVVLSMGLGLFAPPLGVGYYAACAIGRVRPDAGIRPIVGYMLALLVGTIAVAAIPWLSIGFL